MIKAVVFDMFETLVTLFEGRTYFHENIAEDLKLPKDKFKEAWHMTEKDRTRGNLTIEEGLEKALMTLGSYEKESVELTAGKRREALSDSFNNIPENSIELLRKLKGKGILTGLISNCYSDEREFIKNSPLYPYFDVAMLSYEQGIGKPEPEIFRRMIKALEVRPDECLYVGDGGSGELFAARDAGMKTVQTLVFHDKAFVPHIPCEILPEFPHVHKQSEILDYLD